MPHKPGDLLAPGDKFRNEAGELQEVVTVNDGVAYVRPARRERKVVLNPNTGDVRAEFDSAPRSYPISPRAIVRLEHEAPRPRRTRLTT